MIWPVAAFPDFQDNTLPANASKKHQTLSSGKLQDVVVVELNKSMERETRV